ncbi:MULTISPECIES: Fic/DOC family protein [Bradyrhizobium]|jgi:cell filamentation protein|uniref:protein adenylyltransferase n=1 Tax=Bradyrhizobium denitrificans TaxID=2734912 RepID=A0ABS5GAV1_9BRAD|nr:MULTISPECIES: Fic family protein [Bradyrhizobium]MBR1138159.1 Fic family protein [Bradyrhizobium denitrificans]MDU1497827.1 Fic family protein [Bradyrhizobium sp.]MDU1548078.1 Fic family protein [Bradyrhizobium sp.]MDU1805483.1 Fic family protein [Bradyrhizobium sp.]MDU2925140.1 Fic family protein [Bradyrhizobium sp.]
MAFGGYDAFDDPYCYKGTGTLRNKLGIRDAATLESYELEMTTLRAKEPLPTGNFDPRHYRRVHHHLFQDVYSWAGKYRTVRTSKGGNPFCFPENIASAMDKVFRELVDGAAFTTNDPDQFVGDITHFLAELNAVHPFREGNGRSQLSFIDMIGARAGFAFDFARVERDTFLPAMIASYAGDLGPLTQELSGLLHVTNA